jgi:hypothetical protein
MKICSLTEARKVKVDMHFGLFASGVCESIPELCKITGATYINNRVWSMRQ